MRSIEPRNKIVLVVLIALLTGTAAFPQAPVAAGQIQGTIVGRNNQPVAKATVSVQQQVSGTAAPFRASTITGTDGSFAFTEVPVGTFTICIQVPGSAYLNPCTWTGNPPTVTVAARQIASVGRIRLDEGRVLKVRLNDANRLLQADERKVRGAQVLVGIWAPSGLFVPMRIRTKGITGRNLELPVPVGPPLQLTVNSSYFELSDENNAKLDATKGVSLPVQASSTAASRAYTFNITGRGAGAGR